MPTHSAALTYQGGGDRSHGNVMLRKVVTSIGQALHLSRHLGEYKESLEWKAANKFSMNIYRRCLIQIINTISMLHFEVTP